MKTLKLLALSAIILLSACSSTEDKLCNKEWVFSSAGLYDESDKIISSTEDQTKPIDEILIGRESNVYFSNDGNLIITYEDSKKQSKYRISDDVIIVTDDDQDSYLYITKLTKNRFEFKLKDKSSSRYIIQKYKLLPNS